MNREEFDRRMEPIVGRIGKTGDWQWDVCSIIVDATRDATEAHGVMRRFLDVTTETEFPARNTGLSDGQAYILHGNDGEVRVTPMSSYISPTRVFRIASFPMMDKWDWIRSPEDRWAFVDGTANAFWKQEDARFIMLLDVASTNWAERDNDEDTENHRIDRPYSDIGGRAALHPDKLLLLNDEDHRVPSGAVHWRVGGQRSRLVRSPRVPLGTAYLVPTGVEDLGVVPVGYEYQCEPNSTLEKFNYGFVVDEMIGMAILNPRGIEVFQDQEKKEAVA